MHRERGDDIQAKLDDMQPAVDDIQCSALIMAVGRGVIPLIGEMSAKQTKGCPKMGWNHCLNFIWNCGQLQKSVADNEHHFIASKNGNSMRAAVLLYSVIFICGLQPFFGHFLGYGREKVFGFGGRLNFICAVFVQHFIVRFG